MNPDEESDIKRSFAYADNEIKEMHITVSNSQTSMYTSRLINTKEIILAYESAEFGDFSLLICALN
ncbi:8253_t:CDS:2 [Dentiscutata erythropus]|uniref:8253_t:CDS:1 n=1 Tax=Dentiscutata erythropus TaxID=1348616 RepID=A0A9N9EP35_9GLOM|nr:8253_t:CDS:2 [Dentiscutata erythropus]